MTVHIIYDPRRIEKWQPLMDELERQRISDYKIWNPVEDTSSVVSSINKTHKKIIQWAKNNDLSEICVLEEDCQFPAKDGFDYFIKNKPQGIWRMYLGGAYAVEWYLPLRGVVTHFVGMHCYIMNNIFYDPFLSIPNNIHIDTAISDMIARYEIAVVCCYPFAAIQREGWSANNMKVVNYNSILKPEDVYGGLPKN